MKRLSIRKALWEVIKAARITEQVNPQSIKLHLCREFIAMHYPHRNENLTLLVRSTKP